MQNLTLPHDGAVECYNWKEGARLLVDRARCSGQIAKGAKKNRRFYYDVIMAFDIETTKLSNLNYNPGFDPECLHYFNICFCWQVMIDGAFIFGRKPEEFFEMLDTAAAELEGYIICYIHNIAYEFNNLRDFFMRGVSGPDDIFMKSRSTPLYLRYKNAFEFRCSKLLTGKSLAKIGADIGYEKLTGDFDYSVLRDYETELTPLEMNYCFRDVNILYKFLTAERVNFCAAYKKRVTHISHLPYTVTGYVRIDVKKIFSNTAHGRYILKQTALTMQEYLEICGAMWGGYTHANFRYIGDELKNIWHVDIVSAYPGAFLTPDGFPFALVRSRDPTTENFMLNLNDPERAVIGRITFHDLQLKRGGVPYVPASKSAMDAGAIVENGKVLFTNTCTITACDVDFHLIMGAYEYSKIDVDYYYLGIKKKLPYNIIKLIEKYFAAKTTLKHVPGREIDYAYAKAKLNSVYGMSCTSLLHPTYSIINGTCVETGVDYEPANTIPYQWAIYITAYTRRLIYGMICEMQKNNTFVYSDTDSIFFKYDRAALDAIEAHNERQREYLKGLQKLYFDITPKNPEGETQYLFTLDVEDYDAEKNETTIDTFCAIGAKRYYIGRGAGVYDVTFSGLRATKSKKGVNGYNTQRLIDMFGSLNDAFAAIKNGSVDLPYVEGVDKLSNYNISADFVGELGGRTYRRPCSYTLYPQSIRLSLNHELKAFLGNVERRNEFE